MSNFSIPRNQWIEVYNSIILLWFFTEEYEKNKEKTIDLVNIRLNDFCLAKAIPMNDRIPFEGGSNMISFCYLIIVRIIEIINKATKNNEENKKKLIESIFETANSHEIQIFDDIVRKYELKIKTFSHAGSKHSDATKFYQLMRHIRHSVSHFSYEINSDSKVHLLSKEPGAQSVKLDMEIPMYQLINITIHFGVIVNNSLHNNALLA
jgi:hypothetical protein